MAIELSASEPEGLFGLVALVVIVAVWLAFFLALRWLRWRGLDDQEKRTVASLRQQLANWSPETVTIPRSDRDDLDVWRDRLLARSQGKGGAQAGVTEALGEVVASLSARFGGVPRLSMYLASEGAALLVAAVAVIASAPVLRRLLREADVGPITALTEFVDAVVTILDVLWVAFPGTSVIWALLTIFVIHIYTWLSGHALEVAIALLGLAVAIGEVDRLAEVHGDRRLYPRRGKLLRRLGGWLVLIYASGALPANVGRELDYGGLGAALGGLLAFVLVLVAIGHGLVESHRRLRATASIDDVGVGLVPRRWPELYRDRITYWYLVLRRVAAVAGVVALPVVIYYVGIAFLGGHVPRLLAALLAAPLPLKLGVVMLAFVGLVGVLGSAKDAWVEVSRAIERAIQQQGVRVAVFVSLGPFVVGLVTLTILLAFGLGLLWAGFAAVTLAVIVRLGYRAWQFVAYKAHTRKRRAGLHSVTVAGPEKIELPATDVWVVRVNATELAWPAVDGLVDDTIETVKARFDGGDGGPQPAEAYFEWVEDTGEPDLENFRRGRSAEARSRFVELIQSTSGRISEVNDRLEREFGDATAAAARRTERELGRVSKDDRFYRLHKRRLE